jgi:hypothetical protein
MLCPPEGRHRLHADAGALRESGRLSRHDLPARPLQRDELQFTVIGVIKDVERLKLLFELFSETLDQLCRIGSAYEQAPDVTV